MEFTKLRKRSNALSVMSQKLAMKNCLGYPYEPWSDSDSDMEECMMPSEKKVEEFPSIPHACVNPSLGFGFQFSGRDTDTQGPSEQQTERDVVETTAENQTSTQLANCLKQLLVKARDEANKLSPKDVRPNLNRLKTALNDAVSLAMYLVRNRMTTEMSAILKEDLQKMSTLVVKLHVPKSKTKKAAYRGLCTVRRNVSAGVHKAGLLHAQIKSEGKRVPQEIPRERDTLLTATSTGSHWKPSLSIPFFLKPSALVFKPLTAKRMQDLAVALACTADTDDTYMQGNHLENVQVDNSGKKLHETPVDRMLVSILVDIKDNSENGAGSRPTTVTQKNTLSTRPQTLIINHRMSIPKATLDAPLAPKSDRSVETVDIKAPKSSESAPSIPSQNCKVGEPSKPAVDLLIGKSSKGAQPPLAGLLTRGVLDDVVDTGLVKREQVSVNSKGGKSSKCLSSSKTLKTTKKSYSFKRPKGHHLHSFARKTGRLVSAISAMKIAKPSHLILFR